MTSERNRMVLLARRPRGWPDESTFELAEEPVPEPGPGEVLVRNVYMSVDPYMRGRMNDVRSYTPPFEVGKPLEGGAIGRIEVSNHDDFQAGDYVQSNLGWREWFVSNGAGLTRLDPEAAPLPSYLGVLGGTGFTAYVGILDVGQPREGETVFVSGAAGATGSVAGQIAKIQGCRVVGSAGSEEKVRWLTEELGFDAAINYRDGDLGEQLGDACPEGIDVFFDNVGGETLEAALDHMNVFGRIAMCGAISMYNAEEPPPGPRNLRNFIVQRLTMRGFLVLDFADRREAFLRDMRVWLGEGQVRARETIYEGIDQAPAAFLDMMRGKNIGKMLVRLAPEA